MASVAMTSCTNCRSEFAADLLSCPVCQHLVHSSELTQLAMDADNLAGSGDLQGAINAWRRALELLPPGSRQYQTIFAKVTELRQRAGNDPTPAGNKWTKLGPWAILLSLAGKLKFLLLGLSKASTLFSMLLSFGVYWTMYGWKFAGGLIACIYVHEMGHVAALRRFGIPATAPMFIPGFGALVRLRQYPATPGEDARTGLAGPLWGLGATVVCALAWTSSGNETWAAIAKVSAWLNLFNLLPIWQLDGGRGFRALNRSQRWIVAVAAAGLFALVEDGILLIIALAAVYRAFANDGPEEGDPPMLWLFIGLLAALSMLSTIPSPVR